MSLQTLRELLSPARRVLAGRGRAFTRGRSECSGSFGVGRHRPRANVLPVEQVQPMLERPAGENLRERVLELALLRVVLPRCELRPLDERAQALEELRLEHGDPSGVPAVGVA